MSATNVPASWLDHPFVICNWLGGYHTEVRVIKANATGSQFLIKRLADGATYWIPREDLSDETLDLPAWDPATTPWAS